MTKQLQYPRHVIACAAKQSPDCFSLRLRSDAVVFSRKDAVLRSDDQSTTDCATKAFIMRRYTTREGPLDWVISTAQVCSLGSAQK